MATRAFFAVEITDDVRHSLGKAQRSLPLAGADAKPVAARNLHVTMHFLGPINDQEIVTACKLAEQAAADIAPFEIVVKGLTAIPPKGKGLKMVWANVDDFTGRLTELHGTLGELLGENGFQVDARPFRPHITLARFRSAKDADAVREGTELYSTVLFGRCYVKQMLLMSSELGKGGPTYLPMATARLRGRA
ncbi:MAG: RNA 2',3'-cyclic phosphodiesterase [Planctomycetota bacterium]|jgi:2'-5' RNA ligase